MWMIPNWGSRKELQPIGLQVWYFVAGAPQCGGPQGTEKANVWKEKQQTAETLENATPKRG